MSAMVVSNEIWMAGQKVGCVKLSTKPLEYINKEPDLTITLVRGTGEVFDVDNPEKYELHTSAIAILLDRIRNDDIYDPLTMTTIYVYLNS